MKTSAEAVALAFVGAINRQDADALAELMTEQHRFVDSLGGEFVGREKLRIAWNAYFRMVPDYTISVGETFCQGPVMVMLGLAQGTFVRNGERKPENCWSSPAALRAYVEDGLIAEWRVYADNEPIRRLIAKSD